MTNLNNPQIHLDALRHEADLYRQLHPIRTQDLMRLRMALGSILEIARVWAFGRPEPRLETRPN